MHYANSEEVQRISPAEIGWSGNTSKIKLSQPCSGGGTRASSSLMTNVEFSEPGDLALSHTAADNGRSSGRSPHGCGRFVVSEGGGLHGVLRLGFDLLGVSGGLHQLVNAL
jgi:hypothetical protein